MDTSRAEQARRRKAFQELAGRLYDRMFAAAEQVHLHTWAEREQRAVEAGQEVQRELLQEHLRRDPAAHTGAVVSCPTCQQPAERKEGRAAREVRTRAGLVRWARAQYYCRHCRRHFSPSRLDLGVGRGRLQSAAVAADRHAERPL